MTFRKIGRLESLVFYNDQIESQNFCVFIEVNISFNEQYFNKALQSAILKHEMLCVYRDLSNFKIYQHMAYDFKVIEIDYDIDNILIGELNNIFFDGPLWRVRIFKKDQETSLIVLTFHHAIADARSAVSFLIDLLALYSDQYHIINFHPLSSSLEEIMHLASPDKIALLDSLHFGHRKQVAQVTDTIYIQKDTFLKLKAFCKKNKITIHSALMGVLLQALFLSTKAHKLNYNSPVDMRKYAENISKSTFGYFLSRINLSIESYQFVNLIELMQKVHGEISANLSEQSLRFLNSLPLVCDLINQVGIGSFEFLNHQKLPVAFISNAGYFSLPKNINFKRFGFAVNSNALVSKNSVLLTVLTINNIVSITLHFPLASPLDQRSIKETFLMLISGLTL